jgi:hypothetical protein
MPLSISILLFFALYLSFLLWVRVQHEEKRKAERRVRLLIRSLSRPDGTGRPRAN